MRTTSGAGTTVAAVTVLVAALSGCGGEAGEEAAAATRAPASATEAPVPEGTWSKVATTADAEALGLDPALAADVLGPDGEMPVDLEVAGDEWKVYVTDDAGRRELGDSGTWQAGTDGRWLTTSESPGCRGCEAPFLVTVDDDRMSIELDDGDAPAVDVHLVMEGSWTRQS